VVMTGEKSEPVSGPKPAQVPAKPAALPRVAHKNVHILLAEDNPVNQKVALRQLQKLGYAADAVANGLEVLDALKQIPYALILMDCQMPEMDGYEATRQIRQLEYRGSLAADRKVPLQIVAMTANALRGDREKCLESGMDDYISKPVVLAELEAALNRALARVFPETPSPAEPAPPASTADVLDAAVLAGLRELREPGQPDPLAEVADLFLQDSPPRLAKIKQHYEEKDATLLERVAHSLKGSAGNLGARRLAGFCADIEKLAKTGNLDSAAKLVEQLGAEYQRVQAALEVEKTK
jgi:two-component system sensor histidine kinase/response regulator